jgi:tRNA (cmo5U34)-methyltransferase
MPIEKHLVPGKKWEFDAEVTDAFDEMLARSIPQYDVMRKAVFDIGGRFVEKMPKSAVVALGCSRGADLAKFVDRFGAFNQYVGVDVSAPMLEAARERFKGYISSGIVSISECDLRRSYPPFMASLTLSILTLQFTPIEYRQQIVRSAFKQTLPGGAFILVEKVMGHTAEGDGLLTDLYLGLKAEQGYGADEIARKRLSLEGVLVPVTAKWNEELLATAGFRVVECFWRFLNFAAWVAVKE